MPYKKPKKCVHPDCFNCPYVDCRWDEMTTQDFTETNKRDYELYEDSTGKKYHKGTDYEYKKSRNNSYRKENNRAEYYRGYYVAHADEIKEKQREKYDTVANTAKCRKWREENKDRKREYDRQRYLKRKEEKKVGSGNKTV